MWAKATASQKLPRDSGGESIFAARHVAVQLRFLLLFSTDLEAIFVAIWLTLCDFKSLAIFLVDFPDPPTLAFLKKAREIPEKKARVFSLRGTPKIIGNERKTPPLPKTKQGKSEKKKARKSKKNKG